MIRFVRHVLADGTDKLINFGLMNDVNAVFLGHPVSITLSIILLSRSHCGQNEFNSSGIIVGITMNPVMNC